MVSELPEPGALDQLIAFVREHNDELLAKSLYEQNLRGEFRLTIDQILSVDPLRLEEFERILKEEAFLRNLQLFKIENHDLSITIRWMPMEEVDRV